jgi:hypothetical protein
MIDAEKMADLRSRMWRLWWVLEDLSECPAEIHDLELREAVQFALQDAARGAILADELTGHQDDKFPGMDVIEPLQDEVGMLDLGKLRASALDGEVDRIPSRAMTKTAVTMNRPRFRDYIKARLVVDPEDNPTGDLVRELLDDSAFPTVTTYPELKMHLLARGACPEAQVQAAILWRQYRKAVVRHFEAGTYRGPCWPVGNGTLRWSSTYPPRH